MKQLELTYDSLLPKDIPYYDGNLILTTKQEAPKTCEKPILFDDVFEQHVTIIRAKMLQTLEMKYQEDELVVGVDPGQRIGLSVSYLGRQIESSHHYSVEKLVMHIIMILGSLRAKRKIVKIGNGNMKIAKEIGDMLNLRFCSSFELEFVDERRTSTKVKNYNQGGKRDRLAAKYISQRKGFTHFVLPLSRIG